MTGDPRMKPAVGETPEWEAAYRRTRRSIPKRKKRLSFFDWPDRTVKILDLGSGDGLDLQALREMGYQNVIAFDASSHLLSNVTGTRVVGDAHFPPFDSNSLDVVLANSVLHHFDFPEMVGEVARILKPGGCFCFMEPRPSFPRQLLDVLTMSDLAGRLVPYFKHRKEGLLEEYEVHYRWLDLYPSVESLLDQNGFRSQKVLLTMVGVFAQWKLEPPPHSGTTG